MPQLKTLRHIVLNENSMLTQAIQQQLLQLINQHTGSHHTQMNMQPIGGGSINQTYCLQLPGQYYFLKCNSLKQYPGMLQKEATALQFLADTNTIKTPEVIFYTAIADTQILLLKWIDNGQKEKGFWKCFGEQLAALHQITNTQFGWTDDNYMGSIPQSNKWEENWTEFLIERRLHPLVQKCFDQELLSTKEQKGFENVYKKLPLIFNATEKPSLVHGDLWSGNFICNQQQQPVLIDPAIHYGHRSADMAMTTLFGGFDHAFYQSYHYHFALPENYKEQWAVCNLYPLLVHLLLFGRSYLSQIQQTLYKFV